MLPEARGSVGDELAALAAIHGASGDESRVIEFIRERIPGELRTGANGSLVATFGEGSPRILVIAGVDEPGLLVSGIHERGYLWLRPMAEGPIGGGPAQYFRGQHVHISTRSGSLIPGVVAAPSVHFASIRGARRNEADGTLLVDIGASSARQAAAAGVAVLDRVTLEKESRYLAGGWLAAPWVSSRAGAALLLTLGQTLEQHRFAGTVTLAFVTQQYPHNAGLGRVLGSVPADHVVLIAPNGGTSSEIAPAAGSDPSATSHFADLAREVGVRLERKYSHALDFGPFGRVPWQSDQQLLVLHPAVRNAGTPAETVSTAELEGLARFLRRAVGLPDADDPQEGVRIASRTEHISNQRLMRQGLEDLIKTLVELPGISGKEGRVRDRIRELLPSALAPASRVDDAGNLVVRLGRGGEASAAFIAHMDEIGFSLQEPRPGGSVGVTSRGGGSRDLFAWQPASIHGPSGTLPAVMKRDSVELGGISGEEVRAMGVTAESFATVPKRYRKLLGDRISARSLDDRLGCAVLVEAARRLAGKARRATGAVDLVFSVEEEVGLNGARHYAGTARPARVYPIDTFVTSDSPFGPQGLAPAALGAGAVLRAVDESGTTPLAEVERVRRIASERGIRLQVGVTAGGNDGSVFASLETANIPIGFPLRYAHTPVETADLRDAEAAADLVEALALEELRGR